MAGLAAIEATLTADLDALNVAVFHTLMYAIFIEDAGPQMALQLRRLCAKLVPALAPFLEAPDVAQPEGLQKAAVALGLGPAAVAAPRIPAGARTSPWMSRMSDKK